MRMDNYSHSTRSRLVSGLMLLGAVQLPSWDTWRLLSEAAVSIREPWAKDARNDRDGVLSFRFG